ncbi:MAG: hypothetical protein P4L50_30180 [Anaerolineaceae bacterium]|nr:hypothetical protein [Anaerolineaceae bacterium]
MVYSLAPSDGAVRTGVQDTTPHTSEKKTATFQSDCLVRANKNLAGQIEIGINMGGIKRPFW